VAPPGGFLNFIENDVGYQLCKFGYQKSFLSVLVASKINNFNMLPLYEVEI
jgi:hypothetical protein